MLTSVKIVHVSEIKTGIPQFVVSGALRTNTGRTQLCHSSPLNRKQVEKWLILGFRLEIYKMSLRNFIVPESKELLK